MATTLVVRGGDRVRGMLDWYSDRTLFNRMRRAVRAGSKVFQARLKSTAAAEPTGNVPASFRKVPAPKVSGSARRGGAIVGVTRPKSPLFNVFEPGAAAHEIGGSGLLAGPAGGGSWTPAGRKRGRAFGAHGRVHHPGMKARPILPTAFASGQTGATDAIAHVLFEPSHP